MPPLRAPGLLFIGTIGAVWGFFGCSSEATTQRPTPPFDLVLPPLADAGLNVDRDAGIVDTAPARDGGLLTDDACNRLMAGYCRYAGRCEARLAVSFQQLFVCHPSTVVAACDLILRSAQADFQEFRAEQVDGCLSALESASCAYDAFPDACARIAEPQRALGQTCYDNGHCTTGRCARNGACPGRCLRREPEGGSCRQESDCAPGHYCGFDGICARRVGADEACQSSLFGDDCEVGWWCAPDTNTCVPLGGDGDACTAYGAYQTCSGELLCSGERCTSGGDEGDACGSAQRCAIGLRCDSGRCRKRADPGDSCASRVECPLGFMCRDGSCQPRPIIGEPCEPLTCLVGVCLTGTCTYLFEGQRCDEYQSDNPVCFGGFCQSGVCVLGGQEGAGCNSTSECQFGLQCQGRRCRATCALPP